MSVTHMRRHIAAPRAAVYRALLDPRAIAEWKVPDGMTAEVHELDARVAALEAEIERTRARRAFAANHRASAEELFRPR